MASAGVYYSARVPPQSRLVDTPFGLKLDVHFYLHRHLNPRAEYLLDITNFAQRFIVKTCLKFIIKIHLRHLHSRSSAALKYVLCMSKIMLERHDRVRSGVNEM